MRGLAQRPKGIPFVTHAIRWLPDGAMEDLGTFGGRNAGINAINSSGEMIVNVDLGPFVTRVLFVRRDKPPIDIGNLGGSNPQGGSLAPDLSNRGQVTGLTENSDGAFHAFLWSEQRGMRDIAVDDDVSTFTIASGINSAGTIVGRRVPLLESERGFVWTEAAGLSDLATLGGAAGDAIAINEPGDIVGVSDLPGTPVRPRATLWRRSRGR